MPEKLHLNEALKRCSAIANRDGPMEVNDSCAFVFANAVVTFSMNEGRSLQIAVTRLDHADIFAEEIDDIFENKDA